MARVGIGMEESMPPVYLRDGVRKRLSGADPLDTAAMLKLSERRESWADGQVCSAVCKFVEAGETIVSSHYQFFPRELFAMLAAREALELSEEMEASSSRSPTKGRL